MRARYLGDHDSVTLWGIHFPRGVYVQVSDAHAQRKVAGNNHFEVESSDAEDVEFVETAKPDPVEPAQASDAEASNAEMHPRQKRPYNRRT